MERDEAKRNMCDGIFAEHWLRGGFVKFQQKYDSQYYLGSWCPECGQVTWSLSKPLSSPIEGIAIESPCSEEDMKVHKEFLLESHNQDKKAKNRQL